jgi:hypothetical protein
MALLAPQVLAVNTYSSFTTLQIGDCVFFTVAYPGPRICSSEKGGMLWWWRGGSWAQAPFYHKLGSKLGHTSYSMIELFGLLIYEMIKSECLEL